MKTSPRLAGLERLLAVCQKHGIAVDTLPPGRTAPTAGELFMGQPFDPLLAAAFARFGRLMLSPWHSLLTRCDDEVHGLVADNEDSRKYWPEPFHALTVFGSDMRYSYAAVPALANDRGFQPVVWIDPYEQVYALPVASDVDRFFDLHSRYLELVADEPDFRERHVPSLTFPWDVPELMAADAPLVEMMGAGLFDRWMYATAKGPGAAIRDWVSRVDASRRSRG
jgi:hypothetical protein